MNSVWLTALQQSELLCCLLRFAVEPDEIVCNGRNTSLLHAFYCFALVLMERKLQRHSWKNVTFHCDCVHLFQFQCNSKLKLDYFGHRSTNTPRCPGPPALILPGSCACALLPASHVMPHCMTTKARSIWLKASINRERRNKWERRKSHSCLSAVHDKQRSCVCTAIQLPAATAHPIRQVSGN